MATENILDACCFGTMCFFWILVLLGFVFWIFMLVDAAKRKYPKEDQRLMWIIIVALTGLIGALIYYFIIKRKDDKKTTR